jgi:hypothetical protein
MTSPELTEFYRVAPGCLQLTKKGLSWNLSWTCKTTGRPCSPRECPDRPYLKELFHQDDPALHEKSSNSTPDLELAPQPAKASARKIGPQVQIQRTRSCEDVSVPTIPFDVSIRRRQTAKSHSRPHVDLRGRRARALITFQKRGVFQRWACDLLYMPDRNRRVLILEFPSYFSRFFFPLETPDEVVKHVVGSWFESLKLHDENVCFNTMGSPTPYAIKLTEA